MTIPEDSAPVAFRPPAGARSVRLRIADASGRPTVVLVHQRGVRKHHVEDLEFCANEKVFDLETEGTIEVRVFSGVCHNHRYGVATTGTITATFAR